MIIVGAALLKRVHNPKTATSFAGLAIPDLMWLAYFYLIRPGWDANRMH